jgi:hypothetical protein
MKTIKIYFEWTVTIVVIGSAVVACVAFIISNPV